MSLFILLFAGTMAISLLAALRVKSAYAKYSQHSAASGYTGAEAAEQILQAVGVYEVQVVELDELLGDHYDPPNKRLVLSSGNFHSRSTAALGIAAHECGHAIQHKVGYAPLQWRMAAVELTSFASQAVLWLPLVGMFTGILSGRTGLMIMAIAWGVIMLFNLVTLPVEYDASRRAKKVLPQWGSSAKARNRSLWPRSSRRSPTSSGIRYRSCSMADAQNSAQPFSRCANNVGLTEITRQHLGIIPPRSRDKPIQETMTTKSTDFKENMTTELTNFIKARPAGYHPPTSTG